MESASLANLQHIQMQNYPGTGPFTQMSLDDNPSEVPWIRIFINISIRYELLHVVCVGKNETGNSRRAPSYFSPFNVKRKRDNLS
jgi:hypothetical protein